MAPRSSEANQEEPRQKKQDSAFPGTQERQENLLPFTDWRISLWLSGPIIAPPIVWNGPHYLGGNTLPCLPMVGWGSSVGLQIVYHSLLIRPWGEEPL